MNELLNILVANNKILVALETRLINIESKIDAMNNPIGKPEDGVSRDIAIPKEYPQSAGETDVAEQI